MPYITNELQMKFPYHQKESPMYRLIYNKHILDNNGHFNSYRLQLLGLMRCKHPDIESKYTMFWEFANPELEQEIPAGDIMDLIEEMAIIALPVL